MPSSRKKEFNMASQAISTIDRNPNPVAVLAAELEKGAREFKKALPAHITPEKLQRTILTAVQNNPKLLQADRRSLLNSAMKAAQDGLLPDGREAAFVEFRTNEKIDGQWQSRQLIQYMPMVYGLRKKIVQSGEITSLEVNIVYAAEVGKGAFLYEVGLEPPLRHRPALDLTEAETGDDQVVAAYSIATFKDGTKSYELMRRFEIEKVREASQTGSTRDKKGQAKESKGPWRDWFPEMAKKTVMRRHSKSLPMSGDILDVEVRDDLVYGESTMGVLGSAEGGQPQLSDRTDEEPEHDAETGELIETGGEPTEVSQAAIEDAKPKRTRGPNKSKADAEPEQPDDFANVDDQTGLTKHPAEDAADALLSAMKDATTVIDLDRHWKEAETKGDLEAMPDEIYTIVLAEHEKHGERLGRKTQRREAAQ
jgi:recombination protein RecT